MPFYHTRVKFSYPPDSYVLAYVTYVSPPYPLFESLKNHSPPIRKCIVFNVKYNLSYIPQVQYTLYYVHKNYYYFILVVEINAEIVEIKKSLFVSRQPTEKKTFVKCQKVGNCTSELLVTLRASKRAFWHLNPSFGNTKLEVVSSLSSLLPRGYNCTFKTYFDDERAPRVVLSAILRGYLVQ